MALIFSVSSVPPWWVWLLILVMNHDFCLRVGRATNSPWQFGQTFLISAVQDSQKVHS